MFSMASFYRNLVGVGDMLLSHGEGFGNQRLTPRLVFLHGIAAPEALFND